MNYRVFVIVLSVQLSAAVQLYKLTRGTCPEKYLKCSEGQSWRSSTSTDVCFHEQHLCDNETDCTDSSDEKFCPGNVNYGEEGATFRFLQGPCPFDFVLCKTGNQLHTTGVSDKRCIKKAWVCDGTKSCSDGSDEKYCPYDLNKGFIHRLLQDDCPQGYFKCRTGAPKYPPTSIDNKLCIPKSWICNKNSDCADGSDEKFCPYFFPEDEATADATSDDQSNSIVDLTGYQEVLDCIADSKALVTASFAIALSNTAVVLATAGYYFWGSWAQRQQLKHLERMAKVVGIGS